MQIAIFIACCFIIGMLIGVCFELRWMRRDIKYSVSSLLSELSWVGGCIIDEIPNAFEYNGMRGKVFKK